MEMTLLQVFLQEREALWRFAKDLIRQDLRHRISASEVLNVSCLDVVRRTANLADGTANLRSLAYEIVRNNVLDLCRWHRAGKRNPAKERPLAARKSPSGVEEIPIKSKEATASEGCIRKERNERLLWAIEQLPEDERKAIRLFYIQELSIKAIAEKMTAPEGTVKSWLSNARVKLRALLANFKEELRDGR